jgi:hypothetical protein
MLFSSLILLPLTPSSALLLLMVPLPRVCDAAALATVDPVVKIRVEASAASDSQRGCEKTYRRGEIDRPSTNRTVRSARPAAWSTASGVGPLTRRAPRLQKVRCVEGYLVLLGGLEPDLLIHIQLLLATPTPSKKARAEFD